MENTLTDRRFWEAYWNSKENLAVSIPSNYLFHNQLKSIVAQQKISSAIELGGFPGYYAVFLRKHLGLNVTLLDFFIHQPITENLLKANNLKTEDVKIIETDLFNCQPDEQYDLVLSCGLIEHFNDTTDIIKRHISFMKQDGTLFITLPNFKSLNGWFQKIFDISNYNKHNIDCMDPVLLRYIAENEGLEVLQSQYFGKFSIWLENEKEKTLAVRIFKKAVWFLGKVFFKIVPIESKFFSPYIILIAKRKV